MDAHIPSLKGETLLSDTERLAGSADLLRQEQW